MGKHDIRTAQTQANELINIILNDPVMISSLARYKERHEFSNPRDIPDLEKVMSLVAAATAVIPEWSVSTPTDEQGLVLHTDESVKYIFQSLADGNVSEPTLSNNTWKVIGYSKKDEVISYTGATGSYTIDFTLNNRQALFGLYPHIEVWSISGSTNTLIPGVSQTQTISGSKITSISLDGVFGDGYILIY
ncbi:hypothetical protein TH53_19715 [Pedobacter lusitanus]|uniref:Uncharacterized protein n=1 Tax=Pedobacter lusitanus TaxID=1503925 RepID=A0A0D0F1R2_9SPHI|nr:hypothetical protein [Pedobacter lusitanus]KIO75568.1 hypothetical protein TH53_19715 [Pedobacter lusitanus]